MQYLPHSCVCHFNHELKGVTVSVVAFTVVAATVGKPLVPSIGREMPPAAVFARIVLRENAGVVGVSDQDACEGVRRCRHHLHQVKVVPAVHQSVHREGELHVTIPVMCVFIFGIHLGTEPEDVKVF